MTPKQFFFIKAGSDQSSPEPHEIIYTAHNKVDAYFMFLEDVTGTKLSIFQEDDIKNNLCVGNKLFDFIECVEILE